MQKRISSFRQPTVTFIIPTRSIKALPRALACIDQLKYPQHLIEVLVVTGDNPSLQRNMAAQQAAGEWLYFLDDDSILAPRALEYFCQGLEDFPGAVGFGGPSIGTDSDNCFQHATAIAMGSVFGLGPIRCRYFPNGRVRRAHENDLILANLCVRKTALLHAKGFNVNLYPNEENEFINRLEAAGEIFIYHPLMFVSRPARESLRQLTKQIFRYGASRMHHFRVRSESINAVLFIPTAWVGYCLSLLLTAMLANKTVLSFWSLPLLVYLAFMTMASLFASLSSSRKRSSVFLWLFAIYPTLHLSYGVGMPFGLINRALARGSKSAQSRLFVFKSLSTSFNMTASAAELVFESEI